MINLIVNKDFFIGNFFEKCWRYNENLQKIGFIFLSNCQINLVSKIFNVNVNYEVRIKRKEGKWKKIEKKYL